MKSCEICSKLFDYKITKTPNKKFCGKACLAKHNRIMGKDIVLKKCAVCFEVFEANKYIRKDRVTCSRSCGNHKAWDEGKGRRAEMRIRPKKCEWCERGFITPDKIVKYCGVDCRREARKKLNDDKRPNDTPCLICGKLKRFNRKYCSLKCYAPVRELQAKLLGKKYKGNFKK